MAFKHQLIRVSDLDLLSTAEWNLGKILAVGDSIPAYRYSATFLSTLRSNIHLSTTSDLCSHPPTPTMSTFSPSHLAHSTPSPLSLPQTTTTAATTSSPSEPLPTLSTYPTTSPSDRTSALRLIADSIAQQRQSTSYALLSHPYPLSATILLLGILSQYLDPYTFATTAAGIIMAALLVVRWIASPYIALAEGINFAWLEGPGPNLPPTGGKRRRGHSRSSSTGSNSSNTGGNVEPAPAPSAASKVTGSNGGGGGGKRVRNNSSITSRDQSNKDVENVVFVTKWGDDEIIGAMVMRVSRLGEKKKKAVVRAWTVKRKYRGHGVGRALLEEGVRHLAAREGVKGVGVEFEEGHANSHRVLPGMFNQGFERREKRAKGVLEEVVRAEMGLGR
ncbi:MAG: hypothetical protein LQ338_004835 [Usnochroma carphineum]|nr:MAG: hypothetical protein LQ338_004835 [Usnochroma carphineum]